MFRIFQDVNVLEILRLGLSGLCFLLSLLSFWLIHREQQEVGDPRKGILQAIYVFICANLVTATLVAAAGYLGPGQRKTEAEELGAKTYFAESTKFLVDMTKWTEGAGGPVPVSRSDQIRKVTDAREDYEVPYYTSGSLGITAMFLSHSNLEPEFLPEEQVGDNRKHYLYKVHTADQPKGHFEMVTSQFTFLNGFKPPADHFWEASVAYPSKNISVVIQFPESRPCTKIKVYKIPGIGGQEPIPENQPVISKGGLIVNWVGENLEGHSRIHFDWVW